MSIEIIFKCGDDYPKCNFREDGGYECAHKEHYHITDTIEQHRCKDIYAQIIALQEKLSELENELGKEKLDEWHAKLADENFGMVHKLVDALTDALSRPRPPDPILEARLKVRAKLRKHILDITELKPKVRVLILSKTFHYSTNTLQLLVDEMSPERKARLDQLVSSSKNWNDADGWMASFYLDMNIDIEAQLMEASAENLKAAGLPPKKGFCYTHIYMLDYAPWEKEYPEEMRQAISKFCEKYKVTLIQETDADYPHLQGENK